MGRDKAEEGKREGREREEGRERYRDRRSVLANKNKIYDYTPACP